MARASVTGPAGGPARGAALRAVLTVGAVETEYLRWGSGRPALVLSPALAAAIEAGDVPPSLREMRLIVPVHTTIEALAAPADAAHSVLGAWLRGMIDGLGLDGLTVVVAPSLAPELGAFAAAHPNEILRVVVAG